MLRAAGGPIIMLRAAGAPTTMRRAMLSTAAAKSRPRVLILGTGWGGTKLARGLDKENFDVRLISPANHFLFTPMLPSTAVGTLEFRAIQEPVRTIPGLSEYYQAKARTIDLENRTVACEGVFTGRRFDVAYDYLVVAVGNKTNTFNTPGVVEREGEEVFFLKHLHHARQIRNRVLECFERAANPVLSEAEKQRVRCSASDARRASDAYRSGSVGPRACPRVLAQLLSFVVVGGGATSCEFTTE